MNKLGIGLDKPETRGFPLFVEIKIEQIKL